MPKTDTVRTIYVAACGCEAEPMLLGSPRWKHCSLHGAAAVLLAALRQCVEHMEWAGEIAVVDRVKDMAQRAIAEAEGQ